MMDVGSGVAKEGLLKVKLNFLESNISLSKSPSRLQSNPLNLQREKYRRDIIKKKSGSSPMARKRDGQLDLFLPPPTPPLSLLLRMSESPSSSSHAHGHHSNGHGHKRPHDHSEDDGAAFGGNHPPSAPAPGGGGKPPGGKPLNRTSRACVSIYIRDSGKRAQADLYTYPSVCRTIVGNKR